MSEPENLPSYIRAELETYVEETSRFDSEARYGTLVVFVVTLGLSALGIWGIVLLIEDSKYQLLAAISLIGSMVIAAVSYWGYLLLPRLRLLCSQLRGIGQRVYDSQEKLDRLSHDE